MKYYLLIPTLLIILILFLNTMMYWMQASMIFYPNAEQYQIPTHQGLEYEDVWLEPADGVRLHGWYVPHATASKTLLFFHGNAGNISHRVDSISIFHRLNLNVLIVDYRGYGQSSGKPSEKGLQQDAMASWDYLTQTRQLKKQDIIIFGRSLGGAVAARLASRVQPSRLILESTFSSAQQIAQSIYPVLSRLIWLRYQFNTEKLIKQIHAPVLIIHSPQDDVIPFHMGESLFQLANEPKYFLQLKGLHNNGFMQSQPDYEAALARFIK